MHISSSLDWATKETELRHIVHAKIPEGENKFQLHRMISNIGLEVTKLSKAEVFTRRGNSTMAEELLVQINNNIE